MKKQLTLATLFAILLAAAVFAQTNNEVTGEFRNHMMYGNHMMYDDRMMWGAQQYYEGKQRMHLGAGILAGLAVSGLILLEWLLVIKYYREVFKKK